MVKIGNESTASGDKQVFMINAHEELICARLESACNYDQYEDQDENEGEDEGEDDSEGGIKTNDDDFYNSCGDRLTGITFIKAPAT